jgi:hypothetical protein
MTVWVTQDTNKDFSGALQFGDVKFLTDDDVHSIEGPHNTWLFGHLNRRVEKIDPRKDWLVIAGSPYVAATVFMLLGLQGKQSVRVLRWDNRDHRYIPMNINLSETIDNG